MRNVFAVLVSLCVCVTTGSVLLSNNSEKAFASNASINADKDLTYNQVNSSMLKSLPLKELPNNRSHIDEKDLYEHATAKQNNQSERAFIYINQKYKKPSLHQYFRLAQNGPEFTKRYPVQSNSQDLLPQDFEPCKPESVQVNSYFQEYNFPDRSPDMSSYYTPLEMNNCNYKDESNILSYKINRNVDKQQPHKINKIPSEPRDYIELLKSPLLRPTNKANFRPKYDSVLNANYPSPNIKQDITKNKSFYKQYGAKTNNVVDERKLKGRKNYGYSPYVHHNQIARLHKVKVPNIDKDFVNDEETSRILEKVQDEDKLLDLYLKDTLDDQVLSNDEPTNDCRYQECLLQGTKNVGVGPLKEKKPVECKCGAQIKLKQNEAHVLKERPGREEFKKNQTSLRKQDITFYEEILREENKKNNLELKLINKLNNTLYH